jgi:hypothetical protein
MQYYKQSLQNRTVINHFKYLQLSKIAHETKI